MEQTMSYNIQKLSQSAQKLSQKVPDMTMRDVFAMHALTITKAEGDYVKAAEEAYKIADAMLAARVHD